MDSKPVGCWKRIREEEQQPLIYGNATYYMLTKKSKKAKYQSGIIKSIETGVLKLIKKGIFTDHKYTSVNGQNCAKYMRTDMKKRHNSTMAKKSESKQSTLSTFSWTTSSLVTFSQLCVNFGCYTNI